MNSDGAIPIYVPAKQGRPTFFWAKITFASGVATVVDGSHLSETTCVRQGGTGIYDVLLRGGVTKYLPIGNPVIADTNDTVSGTISVISTYGAITETGASSTFELKFLETEGGTTAILAPRDTVSCFISGLILQ